MSSIPSPPLQSRDHVCAGPLEASSRDPQGGQVDTAETDAARRFGGKLLVVAAHPDDETIGCGATLGRLARRGVSVSILHATDGAPRDTRLRPTLGHLTRMDAAARRREELSAAIALQQATAAPLAPVVLLPPPTVADLEAPAHAEELARRIARWIEAGEFDLVLTHPYEGGHPDHDAAAFAAHAGVALARSAGLRVALAEMTSYHRASGGVRTGTFREGGPAPACGRDWAVGLDREESERKRQMLSTFRSQASVLQPFGVEVERFRCAPGYDFTRPPHPSPLHYELQPFGWSGASVCAHLRCALTHLGLAEAMGFGR